MKVSYNKLWKLLTDENMKRIDLLDNMPEVKDKQLAIANYFKNYNDSYYRNNIFPIYPGSMEDRNVRVSCPDGFGDDIDPQSKKLVDAEKRTLYVWNFIRKVGNVGSHGVLTEDNLKWLEKKYIRSAIKEMCNRMSCYFFHKYRKSGSYIFDEEKSCYGSRQTFFSLKGERKVCTKEIGILPSFKEQKCITVVPEPILGDSAHFNNHRGRYAIVRAYNRDEDDEDLKNFLLQSQRANLIIQEFGGIKEIPEYMVLADLRFKQDYYVVSYVFNTNPMELNYSNLIECGIFGDFDKVVSLFLSIMECLHKMNKLNIFHRTFSHHSVLLEKGSGGHLSVDIIDLETCKIFDEDSRTVYSQSIAEILPDDGTYRPGKGNLKQYNRRTWDVNTSEDEYQKIVNERAADVCMNILCPNHLEEYYDDDYPATKEEVMSSDNSYLWDNPVGEDRRLIEKMTNLLDALRISNINLEQAINTLRRMNGDF